MASSQYWFSLFSIVTGSLICNWEEPWRSVGHVTKVWPMRNKWKWCHFWAVPLKGRGRPSLYLTFCLAAIWVWRWFILDHVGPRTAGLHIRRLRLKLPYQTWTAYSQAVREEKPSFMFKPLLVHVSLKAVETLSQWLWISVKLILVENIALLIQLICFNR